MAKGLGFVPRVIGGVGKGLLDAGKGVFKSMTNAGSLRDPRALQKLATDSLKLYGVVAGTTYGVRMIRGQKPWQNSQGKRNIFPFLPM